MWTIDFTRAFIVGALAVAAASGRISIVALAAVTFLLGTAETVFDNAASSIVPTVVADSRLESANSWLFATQTAMSTFVGAPVGGLLFAIGDSVPLTVDAVSFFVAAAIVLRLPGRYLERSATAETSMRTDVVEGLAAAGAVAHRYGLHAPYLVSAVLVAVVALIALPRLRWPEAQPASA
ncbi:MAG: antibiotic transporter [Pseudonocardiales bacterium]|nr:antibiotic transporter [Pseudonocardiales bacterium]